MGLQTNDNLYIYIVARKLNPSPRNNCVCTGYLEMYVLEKHLEDSGFQVLRP